MDLFSRKRIENSIGDDFYQRIFSTIEATDIQGKMFVKSTDSPILNLDSIHDKFDERF